MSNSNNFKQIETVVVVCAANNAYAMPLAVTLSSVAKNLGKDYQLICYVIDGGIRKGNKNKILKSLPPDRCKIIFIQNADRVLGKIQVLRNFQIGKFSEPNYITRSAYYRLLIPELVPKIYDKAIYLDCDLVVRGDLAELWKIDIEDNFLLAVQDFGLAFAKHLLNHEELDISPDWPYFNSGVMVLNLQKWRDNKTSYELLKYLKTKRELIRFHDQDVLNAVLAKKWEKLDPKWNVTPNIYYSKDHKLFSDSVYENILQDPYIIHYATAAKPWNFDKLAFDKSFAYRDIFYKYISYTDWAGWRLTKRRLLQAKIFRKLRQLQLFLKR